MYTRWARAPPSAWRNWAPMMLAGSLLAAIADAKAWRSMWGWAASPTLAARRPKARRGGVGVAGGARRVGRVGGGGPKTPAHLMRLGIPQEGPAESIQPHDAFAGRWIGFGDGSERW